MRLITLITLFLLLLQDVWMKFATNNYCCLKCGDKHIMCQHPNKYEVGPNCKDYKRIDLDETKVLSLYNRMKSVKAVYAGASDAMKMQWDYELEEIAQRWANQCPNSTDQCRDTARSPVNQIVDSIVNEQFVSPTWESVFLKWYIQEIPQDVIENFRHGEWSSLSQLVWSSTERVGCAASSHLIETGRLVTMVCNYSPPGNIVGQKVYELEGGMCTRCPTGTICKDATNVNLCVYDGAVSLRTTGTLMVVFYYLRREITGF